MMYKSWQVPDAFLTHAGDEEVGAYLLQPGRRQDIDEPMVCLFNLHDGEVGSWE